MEQNESKIKIIKNLIDKANSTHSIEESESCMLKAQELLQKYNIDMSDVTSFTTKDKVTEIIVPYTDTFEWTLCGVICQNNFCRMIRHPYNNTTSIIGRSTNAEICEYLFTFFKRSIIKLAFESYKSYVAQKKQELMDLNVPITATFFKKQLENKYINDYFIGAISGVDDKMREQKRVAIDETSNLRALIRVNDDEVGAYIKQKYPNLGSSKEGMKTFGSSGYGNGYKDGQGISSNSGISKDGKATIRKMLN